MMGEGAGGRRRRGALGRRGTWPLPDPVEWGGLGGGRGRRSTGWRSGEAGVVRGAGWFDPDPIWIGRGERWRRGGVRWVVG